MSKGHNFFGGMSAEHLKQFIERIERLEIEKKDISEDIKSVYNEAKSTGFDAPTMKEIIRLRRLEKADREEEEYLLDTYKMAMGMAPQRDLFEPEHDEDGVVKEPKVTTSIKIGNKTFKDVDFDKLNKMQAEDKKVKKFTKKQIAEQEA